jgi:hypothetical protein
MAKYAGASFLKVEDVRSHPITAKIVKVAIGKYDKPVLTLSSGDQLTLNQTNVRTLCRAYGNNDHDWLDNSIEVHAGEIEYEGRMQPAIMVRPIPADPVTRRWEEPPPDHDALDGPGPDDELMPY